MIISYEGLQLLPDKHFGDENTFTVITGKNGSGKSSFLGSLVSYINKIKRFNYFDEEHLRIPYIEITEDLFVKGNIPSSVIAASTGVFDKFPIPFQKRPIPDYSYLGLRDIRTSNFAQGYLRKIISSLLDITEVNPRHLNRVFKVFSFLDYAEEIELITSLALSPDALEMLSAGDIKVDNTNFKSERIYHRSELRLQKILENINHDELELLINLIRKSLNYSYPSRFMSRLTSERGFESDSGFFSPSELSLLIKSGVYRLDKVMLSKRNGSSFSIENASSGEQSVLLNLLGIGSKIKDGSLICIDEPEVCLHPEWQAKYIDLLIKTFSEFKGCHFIIATHSPQIISELSSDSAYIAKIGSNQLKSAKDYRNHSADFQLVEIFESPGFKNEYLSRLCFSILSGYSLNKVLSPEGYGHVKLLKEIKHTLKPTDPILSLIEAIEQIPEENADNK